MLVKIGDKQIIAERRERLKVDSEILPHGEIRITLSINVKVAEYLATIKRSGRTWQGAIQELSSIHAETRTRVELIKVLESELLAWYRKNKI